MSVQETSQTFVQLLNQQNLKVVAGTLQMEDVKRQQDQQSQWSALKVKLKMFSRRELFHVQTKDVRENSKAKLQLPNT